MHSADCDEPRPTKMLFDEHRVIERVLHVLDKLARNVRDGGAIDTADAADVVDFLANFADRCHHGKEEAELFPAMERCGVPRDVGPTAVMRAEHDEGRAHVRAMRAALEAQPADFATFARRGSGFVHLLRDHIMKEDQVLFPMAEQMLDTAAREQLVAIFRRINDHDIGAEEYARGRAIADRLTATYGEPDAPAGPGGASCCAP